jgi:riboflavin kinase/FMN adenylyltransferase
MKIYRQLASVPPPTTPTVATIGNFDGVHLGHQSVIAEVIARARFLSGTSLAITFDPHPAHVLRPADPCPLITPLPRKLELLAATGLDATLVLPFDQTLRHTSAHDFAQSILRDTLHVAEVHEGENFRFGHNAAANITSLSELGRTLNFRVTSYTPLTLRGAPVSSSRIRTLIADASATHPAALAEARALLTRPFSIDSHPAPGRGYGSKYTVPTINLAPYPDLLPPHGVYITTLAIAPESGAPHLASEMWEGVPQTFESVTNIGNRPTFGPDSFAIETHLLHPDTATLQSLPETTPLRLTFLRRLRPEITFDSTPALRTQIARDIARAHRYFHLCRTLT